VSNYLISKVKKGDEIQSQVPLGEFFHLPTSLKAKDYILFAGGIGITPLFSILKTVLSANLANKVYLIFSISDLSHFIYKKELKLLEKQFKDQLIIKLVLSKKEGRLDNKKLQSLLEPCNLKESLFYLCGPKDYMQMIQKHLLSLEVKKTDIHTEDFKVVPQRGPKPDENSVFFNANSAIESEPETLIATLDGETIEIPLNREKSLLEQLIDQGYNPPFSCTSGSCMTCMAKLKEGKVFQLEEGILDEENIKNLEILSCQCYPLSKSIHIDYDNL
ncbi:MAG: iron-sulfur cluster-binding domain-containing protein, partial [Bdellovibrionaceae bacterium]|nr:iron-sulfur cluster-binding domain-containing protein [Pseudobdellovibrionaceae bacterium]